MNYEALGLTEEQVKRVMTTWEHLDKVGWTGPRIAIALLKENEELRAKLSRRSDAGRVEVPEIDATRMMNLIVNQGHGSEEVDHQRTAAKVNEWIRKNARLSPSPQPATGADDPQESHPIGTADSGYFRRELRSLLERMGNADGPWLARYLSRLAAVADPSPQPSADVVVVPREEWVELVAALPLEDLTERELTNWLRDINLERPGSEFVARHFWACAQDWTKRKFSKLRALRSSTNHDSKETP